MERARFFLLITGVIATLGVVAQVDVKGAKKEYELYLANLAAAEAFFQLGNISTSNSYLKACDEKFRGLEWNFLHAALDQSSYSLEPPGGIVYNAIQVSPDGKLVATAGSDSIVTIYSYPDFKIVRQLKGHKGQVSTLAFSGDGSKLVTGGRDHTVMVWEVAGGKLLTQNSNAFKQGIYKVCFSPDGKQVGVVSWERDVKRSPSIWGFAKVLNASDGSELQRIETDNHPAANISFSSDGKNILISTWGEIIYAYNWSAGELLWKFDLSDYSEYNAFHCMDISPDGKTLAVGGTDFRVYIIGVSDGKVLHIIQPHQGHRKIVKAVSFSRNGQWLASAGEDQKIMVWKTGGYEKSKELVGHLGTVNGIAWSENGDAIVSVSADGSLKEWKLGKSFATTYDICSFGPWQTPFTADGRYFLSPCSDEKLALYEASGGKMKIQAGNIKSLSADISLDGSRAVSGGFDGVVRIWDLKAGKELFACSGHTGRVDGVVYHDAERKVFSVGDSTLKVWDVSTGVLVKSIPLGEPVFRITTGGNENTLAVGLYSGRVKLFDARTYQQTGTFLGASNLQEMAMSRDGSAIALFCGKDIEVWNTLKPERKLWLKGHEKSGYGLGFSPDGKYLISGSGDLTFKLWNLEMGICTFTWHGFISYPYNCKIIDNHKIFVSDAEGGISYFEF